MTLILAVLSMMIAFLISMFSYWKATRFAMILMVIGFVSLNFHTFYSEKEIDYLMYISEIIFLGFLYYFIMIHKLMNTDILIPISRDKFRNYLIEHNYFHGFNKFIYNLPIYIGVVSLILIVIYYLGNPNAFESIVDYIFS